MASSGDLNEMLQDGAFHQGLHCLLQSNQSSGTEIHYNLKILTCDPLIICTMKNPKFSVSNQTEEPINEKSFYSLPVD